MTDEKNKDNGAVDLYAGFEHVAQIPADQFNSLKEAQQPVYRHVYGSAPKPDKN